MNAQQLKSTIQNAIMQQEWKDLFAPPEGQQGRGGPDVHTELKGFKKDALGLILDPVMAKFPHGGAPEDVAAELTRIAYAQNNNSAGPFIRFMALYARDAVAPDFLENLSKKQVAPVSAEAFVASLAEKYTSAESREVLDNLKATMASAGRAYDASDIPAAIKRIGDEYDRGGDDYMADEADIMFDAATAMQREAENAGVGERIADWKRREAEWGNPLEAQLSEFSGGKGTSRVSPRSNRFTA